jgi:hypothetical protein
MNTFSFLKSMVTKILTILILFIFHFPLFGLDEKGEPGTQENPYSIPKAASAIKIDGSLDEEAWAHARVLELNYEVSPRENVIPPVRTEVLYTYDRSNFYIGFRCYDPDPSQIRAHLSDRDSFGNDDWVAVEIDTYNDSRRAFTLFSTPMGVQADGISNAAGIKDYNWDMIYDSAGRIFEWGYGIEIAIPFSSLRFQRTKGPQIWGINAVRGYPRSVRYQIWSQPYDRSNTCRVCQYLRIEGFEGVSPGRNIEINPTLTASRTDDKDEFPQGGYTNRSSTAEPGLTARWGITPNLVLSGTANPDFSQVEADAAQLDINQPFALYYPEKRPFFTEGLDFFKTPLNVVYTRTLRDPRWGIKLSGKEGISALGAYLVEDGTTNLIFPGSQYSQSTSLEHSNTSAVFRYGGDIWNNSNIGVLFTNREGGGYFNRIFGADGRLRFSQNDELVFQILGSRTKYSESIIKDFNQPEGEFSDEALVGLFTHKTTHHQLEFGYLDIGANFRADLGFMPRVGIRQIHAMSNYEWRPKTSSWWSRFRLVNYAHYQENSQGTVLDKYLENSISFEGVAQTSLLLGNTLSRQHYNGVEFDLIQFNVSGGIIPSGNLRFNISTVFGDSIDYVNTRKGNTVYLAPYILWNIGAHLLLNLSHIYEKMNVADAWLYRANISQASIVYFFTDKMFIRAILQYYDYRYNVSNYLTPIEPESKQFFTQLLFSYKINPRTVLFLGYSDNYFGAQDYSITRKDYTFFAKIGYAWVM